MAAQYTTLYCLPLSNHWVKIVQANPAILRAPVQNGTKLFCKTSLSLCFYHYFYSFTHVRSLFNSNAQYISYPKWHRKFVFCLSNIKNTDDWYFEPHLLSILLAQIPLIMKGLPCVLFCGMGMCKYASNEYHPEMPIHYYWLFLNKCF